MGENLPFSFSTLQLVGNLIDEHPELELRVEQLEALDALQTARMDGQERALVQMATGLGKTTVIAADVKRFFSENPNARVLFLCHQNDILDQARKRFETIIGSDHSYGNFTGEGKKAYHEVDCLFASLQVMGDWRVAFHEDEFDYVAVDESHHGKAPTYEPTLHYFKPKFMVGVTATPDRHDLKNIREIFGEEIYRLSLEEAIARGLLAAVDYSVITDEIADTSILKDSLGKRLNIKKLDKVIFIPKRDEEIVRIIKDKGDDLKNVKRIVFCKSIEQAEEYAQYFDRAEPLHSKIPKWHQNNIIERFKNSEIDTLLTIDMFNEGIDIPDANQIVFLRSTQSKTVFLQQLGRGLRRVPGKDRVQVLDFVANCDRLTMLDQVWQDIKRYSSGRQPEEAKQLMRLDIGAMDFNESAREILEILAEIETRNALYRDWTAEDSISYYTKLCSDLGRVASWRDVDIARKERGGPSYAQLTKRYFNHRLSELQKACGLTRETTQLTEEDSIGIYRDVCGSKPLNRTSLQMKLKSDKNLPSISKLLQPFNGDIKLLQEKAGFEPINRKGPYSRTDWSAEDSMRAYVDLAGNGSLTARELEYRLGQHNDLPSLTTILKPFGGKLSNLHAEIVKRFPDNVTMTRQPKSFRNRIEQLENWTAEDSIRVYREISREEPISANELERRLREEHPDLPSIRTILKPFNGKMPQLVQAAGYELKRKPKTESTDWSAEDSIRIYQQLSGDQPLTVYEVIERLNTDIKLPSISALIKPFNNRFSLLMRAAGYTPRKQKKKT